MRRAARGGRDDQERRVDGSDERRPSWESEQVWQNDIDLLKPSAGPEKLNSFFMLLQHFLCALLNLVEGGSGDRWCEADPPQGLLHAATLSRRLLLAFAQARADAADPPFISDGGVRGVSGRYRLQPQGTKQTLIGSLLVCRITSAVSRSVTSSHGLLSSIKVVIGRYQA